jgi:hypothetical protein
MLKEKKRETIRHPEAMRRYQARRREIEKKRRHSPVGRTTWEEVG